MTIDPRSVLGGLLLLLALAACAARGPAEDPLAAAERRLAAFDARAAELRAETERELAGLSGRAALERELAGLVALDQAMRGRLGEVLVAVLTQPLEPHVRAAIERAVAERWLAVDEGNTRRLKELLAEHAPPDDAAARWGWFELSRFGPEVGRLAWVLVQHADRDPEFQRGVLARFEALRARGEVDPAHYAFLFDRVALASGRPQRFGTQGRCVARGAWEPFPVEDPDALDARRAAVGLEPFEEYRAIAARLCP